MATEGREIRRDETTDRLREIRQEQGLTLRVAARRVGVSWQALSKIERGERQPSKRTLEALAAAYDVEFVVTAAGTRLTA